MSGDHNLYASGSGDGKKSGWRKRQVGTSMNIYTSETEYLKTQVQRLSALVRAQQITIDKLEAQSEQEPVKMVAYNCTCGRTMKFESVHGVVAPQRTWVGLTDEDVDNLSREMVKGKKSVNWLSYSIEAKLKEKNYD